MSWVSPHLTAPIRAFVIGGAALWLPLALAGGCGQTIEVGYDDELGLGGSMAGSAGSGGAAAAAGSLPEAGQGGEAPCVPVACRGTELACGNCDDDDGDGLVDSLDPDCLGPCDADEAGLSTGLARPNEACRQDCYFDGDNGAGNDRCEWSHACDPLSIAPDYAPSGDKRCAYDPEPMGFECALLSVEQDQACLDGCAPLVPNGCDCFGCCELPGRSGNFYFVGGGSAGACALDALSDPQRCPPCTPVPSCRNTCEACEVCVGTERDAACSADDQCPTDSRACDATSPCDFGDYCVTGCCVRAPEPT